MIQNTCKLRTNNFSCDYCDKHNCQRYIAYQQGRSDAIDEVKQELMDNGFIWTEHALEVWNDISNKLKEQNK